MASDLFYMPFRPAYDSAGLSVPGAKAWFTLTGTNTPSAPYSDGALTVPLANPVVFNGVGRPPVIYLNSAVTYRVRIYARDAEVGVDTPLEEYDPYVPGTIIGASGPAGDVAKAATRTELAGTSTPSAGATRYLVEAGREGIFVWSAANLSANVTADTAQGVYIPPTSAPTGASGAWVRNFSGAYNVKWFGAVGDGVANDTVAIQAACTLVGAVGGGVVFIPGGTFKTTAYILVSPKTIVRGAGKLATVITSAAAGGGGANAHENLRNGSIFHSVAAINSSTAVNIIIEDIGLTNTNGANNGAGYYDRGGTFIFVNRCRFLGFKYHIVFDQTELADIDLCDFEAPLTGCVWLVNGADLSAGASGGFTNRISGKRSQFNAGTTPYGIIDDGGTAHAFVDNNYNGCVNHIRAANVDGLKISGGEFESSAAACIRFENTTLAGGVVGSCSNVYLGDGAVLVPTLGQACVIVISLGNIVLNDVLFGNTASAKFTGGTQVNALYAIGCHNGGGGATFDSKATNHWEVGNDGTALAVRTNLPFKTIAALGFDVGAGGAVTQLTSKATAAPALNKLCGEVTMNNASLAAGAIVSFTMANSAAGARDLVEVNHVSGGTIGAYTVEAVSSAGTITFYVRNNTAGALGEALVLRFALKAGTIT